jgi:hypothetical protein
MKPVYKPILRLTFKLVMILLLLSCSKDETIEQILFNSDLSSGNTSPDAWFYNGYGVRDWAKKTGTGDYCISIQNDISTQQLSYWYQNYLGIIPRGKMLTLKTKIKADNLAGPGVAIVVQCNGDQSTSPLAISNSQGKINIAGKFDWKEYSITLDKVPDDTRNIVVFLVYLNSTTGKVFFDDIILTYKN